MPRFAHLSTPAPAPAPALAPPPSAGLAARRPMLAWALVVLAFGTLFGLAPGDFDRAGPSPERAAQALRPGP